MAKAAVDRGGGHTHELLGGGGGRGGGERIENVGNEGKGEMVRKDLTCVRMCEVGGTIWNCFDVVIDWFRPLTCTQATSVTLWKVVVFLRR